MENLSHQLPQLENIEPQRILENFLSTYWIENLEWMEHQMITIV